MMHHRILHRFPIVAALAMLGSLACWPAAKARAELLTYTVSIMASGSLGAETFTDARVMLSLTADGDAVTESGGIFSTPVAPAFVEVEGIGVAEFTDDIAVWLNTTVDSGTNAFALFVNRTTGFGIFGVISPDLLSYDLRSAVGPVSGTSGLNLGRAYGTTLGDFSMSSGAQTATFTAATRAGVIPEPPSLVALGVGLIGLAAGRAIAVRRRREVVSAGS